MPQAFVDVRLRCAGSAFLFWPRRSELRSEVAARPMADKAKLSGLEMARPGNRVERRGRRECLVSNQLIAEIVPAFGARRNGENLKAMRALAFSADLQDKFRIWMEA
jgi:hypothetical protein